MSSPIVKAPYFEQICHELFDKYMNNLGLKRFSSDSFGSVFYIDETAFIKIGYNPESYPKYSPELIAGFLASPVNFEKPKIREAVGLWAAIPDDVDARKYSLWRFSNNDELKTVLSIIKIDVINVYWKKIYNDRKILRELIKLKGA